MRRSNVNKTSYLGLFMEPDLRATIEVEAIRRDASMSSVIRSIVREKLFPMPGQGGQTVSR